MRTTKKFWQKKGIQQWTSVCLQSAFTALEQTWCLNWFLSNGTEFLVTSISHSAMAWIFLVIILKIERLHSSLFKDRKRNVIQRKEKSTLGLERQINCQHALMRELARKRSCHLGNWRFLIIFMDGNARGGESFGMSIFCFKYAKPTTAPTTHAARCSETNERSSVQSYDLLPKGMFLKLQSFLRNLLFDTFTFISTSRPPHPAHH